MNGQPVSRDNGWSTAERIDVTPLLRAGPNVLAISARDAGVAPCALLVDLTLETVDGENMSLRSDAAWRVADEAADGWQEPGFDDSVWLPAEVVAPYGSGPWGKRLLVGPILTPEKALAKEATE